MTESESPSEIKDFRKFSSQLGLVMEVIKNSDDKERLLDIIETREEYKAVDVDTIDEYDKAINGTSAERRKLYKKYKIID